MAPPPVQEIRMNQEPEDVSKARVYVNKPDGQIEIQHYADQSLAYAVWLGFGRNVEAAFRGAGDKRPVYAWDFVTAR
jgi:hypothetical protein